MAQHVEKVEATAPVAPLRMRQPDGCPYRRTAEIEALIAVLSGLPARELVERSRIDDPNDSHYIPSECVLYFVRRPNFGGDESAFRDLFLILRQRVLRALPVPSQRVAGSTKLAERGVDLDIRDAVLDKFQELLCRDRGVYDERLDFYECRFNSALASLRATARRDIRRASARQEPLGSEGDSTEPSPEVESVLAALRGPSEADGVDFLYRSKLLVAISSLPLEERRVIELLLQEVPIDSQDKDTVTIVKVLGCSEKTVRNRRDRAFARLRDALREEET